MTRMAGALEIWLPALTGREYVIAVDTAGGGADGDYAVARCWSLRRGCSVRSCGDTWARGSWRWQWRSWREEYGGALVVVERNNHGSAVLAYLGMAGDERVRLYEQGGLAGWLTTAASKPPMVSRLGGLLMEEPWLFQSRRMLAECRSYVTQAGGGTGAAAGAHDDCVMAMAIGHAVRAELLAWRGGLRFRWAAAGVVPRRRDWATRRGWVGSWSARLLLGGAGGAGDWAVAGRGAEPADAGGGREAVGGEVSE